MPKNSRNPGAFFVSLAGAVLVLLAGLLLISSMTDFAVTKQAPSQFAETPDPQVLAALADEECALQVKVTPSLATIVGAGKVSYSVSIKNIGQQPCREVSTTASYAPGITFVSAVPAPTAVPSSWRTSQLTSQQEQKIQLVVELAAGEAASLPNKICAVASAAAETCRTTTVERQPMPSDTLSKSTNPTEDPTTSTSLIPSTPKELGLWFWQSPLDISAREAEDVFTQLENDKVNAVYVSVDDYLEIALVSGPTKATKKEAYFAALQQVVLSANQHGIAIDALGGAPDWAVPANRWKGYALIEMIKEYNQLHPQTQLRGLQFDVEPYLLPGYESNKAAVLTQYVAFIDEAMNRMQSVDAAFSLAIPHFFDSTQKWTPAVHYKETTAHTFTHLLSIMSRKTNSTLHLMAYRNYFSGSNGVHELSAPELTEAGTTNVRIIIAQEVGDVVPSYVTFYGQTKEQFFNALQIIATAYQGHASFGGISVNHLVPYGELRTQE